jgi:hypothetical protein
MHRSVSLRSISMRARRSAMTKRKNPPKRPKWTGPLATPIKWTGPESPELARTIFDDREPDEAKQAEHLARYKMAFAREFWEIYLKLRLLKEHFAIPPEMDSESSWMLLSLKLAQCADIPGFRREYWWEGRGKKKKLVKKEFNWTDNMCIALVRHVEEAKTKYEINTDPGALDCLLAKEPCLWNNGKKIINNDTRKKKVGTLITRLSEAKRRIKEKNLHGFLSKEHPILNVMYPLNPKENIEHEAALTHFLSGNYPPRSFAE